MYISASHIGINLKQDYASSIINGEDSGLVICDGIGEFNDSSEAAKLVAECFCKNIFKPESSFEQIIQLAKESIVSTEKLMGTTFIAGTINDSGKVKIGYLGDGGIIHLSGDFANHLYTNHPYRYTQLMLPHKNAEGALTKHISHHSGDMELSLSHIELSLNQPTGDILIFYTDGISTLEEMAIIKDGENRYWRSESRAIQFILDELDGFLHEVKSDLNDQLLKGFVNETLHKLKLNNELEDDASLGIIITNDVLKYYINLKHD